MNGTRREGGGHIGPAPLLGGRHQKNCEIALSLVSCLLPSKTEELCGFVGVVVDVDQAEFDHPRAGVGVPWSAWDYPPSLVGANRRGPKRIQKSAFAGLPVPQRRIPPRGLGMPARAGCPQVGQFSRKHFLCKTLLDTFSIKHAFLRMHSKLQATAPPVQGIIHFQITDSGIQNAFLALNLTSEYALLLSSVPCRFLPNLFIVYFLCFPSFPSISGRP